MVFKSGLPLAVWVGVAVSAVVRVDVHDSERRVAAAEEVTAHGAVRSSDADWHPSPPEADASTQGRTVRSSLAERAEQGTLSGRVTSYMAEAKALGSQALHRGRTTARHVVDVLGTATVVALLVSAIIGGAWVAYKFITDPTEYVNPVDVHGAALYYAWREQQRAAEKQGFAPPPPSAWTPRPWPPPPPPQPRPPAEEDETAPLVCVQ